MVGGLLKMTSAYINESKKFPTYILSTDSEISAQKSLTMELSFCSANSYEQIRQGGGEKEKKM